MPDFIPGVELSRRFFLELVQPVLQADFPNMRYDAGIIGSGSEVLGFDTPISRDHHWGPRVILFVTETDVDQYGSAVNEHFRHHLPYDFLGYPTSFTEIPGEPGILRFEQKSSGPVNHRIDITTVQRFIQDDLGFSWQPGILPDTADWLTFPQQKLRGLTGGDVYHAGLGELSEIRKTLAWYPRDVWLYLLASGWTRIAQEEAFVGRAGDVGDETGSRLIAARLVRDLMQLCFLMERQYAPYAKWFGTAFTRLACSAELKPVLDAVLAAANWRTREQHLSTAYQQVATLHNALGITEPLSVEVSPFHGRPYHVIHAARFANAITAQIKDDSIRRLAQDVPIGSIDQFSDSTDLREIIALRKRLKQLYV